MRSTAERTAAVMARTNELELISRRRKSRGIAAVSVAASLLLITGLSLAMPGLTARGGVAAQTELSAAASMFAGSGALGYIVIGILAFLLGCAVTVLCFRLRKWSRDGDKTP